VEEGAEGKSALYLTNGGHIIVANDPVAVVGRIRAEKAALLRRVLQGPDEPDAAASARPAVPGVTRLSQVRAQ
jgi:hypothetical protein